MNDKKIVNRYDKHDDSMMWELVETKHELGDEIINKYAHNQNVKNFLKVFEERILKSSHSMVSDKKESYKPSNLKEQ